MDYEAMDKAASFYSRVARESKPSWTIEDVCIALQCSTPITEGDLQGLVRLCDTWSIRCNVEEEEFWRNLL